VLSCCHSGLYNYELTPDKSLRGKKFCKLFSLHFFFFFFFFFPKKRKKLTFLHVLTCRIKEFSEWAQCLVLELVVKYVPLDSSEIFDIMNLLEDRLQHANGAVVLATIKVFLQLTLSMTDVHQQVRIKAFFIYSFSSNCQETV
jgi:hypothetical protein